MNLHFMTPKLPFAMKIVNQIRPWNGGGGKLTRVLRMEWPGAGSSQA